MPRLMASAMRGSISVVECCCCPDDCPPRPGSVALPDCGAGDDLGRSDAPIVKCIIDDASTKYGTKDGVRFSVYSREYERARAWIASAACQQTSLGETIESMIRRFIKGRKRSKFEK